jgi:hypothetical protein
LSEELKKRLDEKIHTYQNGLLMYGTIEHCHDSSYVHIDILHSNTNEFCTHSKLVMGTQHFSQQSLDISLQVFEKIYYLKMTQNI